LYLVVEVWDPAVVAAAEFWDPAVAEFWDPVAAVGGSLVDLIED